MNLSQLLIYAVSVLFGVKTIRHMEALPHFCSKPESTSETSWLRLAAGSHLDHSTAQDSAGSKRRQVSEAGLEQRVNAQGPKSGLGSYFRVMLLSDKFSKTKSHCRERCCYS